MSSKRYNGETLKQRILRECPPGTTVDEDYVARLSGEYDQPWERVRDTLRSAGVTAYNRAERARIFESAQLAAPIDAPAPGEPCPRCSGRLLLESDHYGDDVSCLACGYAPTRELQGVEAAS